VAEPEAKEAAVEETPAQMDDLLDETDSAQEAEPVEEEEKVETSEPDFEALAEALESVETKEKSMETDGTETDDELAKLSEAEIGAALGETLDEAQELTSAEPVAAVSEVEDERSADEQGALSGEQALLSSMLAMDPKALRKLLAGAQVTINITFPKEA